MTDFCKSKPTACRLLQPVLMLGMPPEIFMASWYEAWSFLGNPLSWCHFCMSFDLAVRCLSSSTPVMIIAINHLREPFVSALIQTWACPTDALLRRIHAMFSFPASFGNYTTLSGLLEISHKCKSLAFWAARSLTKALFWCIVSHALDVRYSFPHALSDANGLVSEIASMVLVLLVKP